VNTDAQRRIHIARLEWTPLLLAPFNRAAGEL